MIVTHFQTALFRRERNETEILHETLRSSPLSFERHGELCKSCSNKSGVAQRNRARRCASGMLVHARGLTCSYRFVTGSRNDHLSVMAPDSRALPHGIARGEHACTVDSMCVRVPSDPLSAMLRRIWGTSASPGQSIPDSSRSRRRRASTFAWTRRAIGARRTRTFRARLL